jgi:flagellar biosynthesis/type III secretory pathway chaperone
MNEELNQIIVKETEAAENLLAALEQQHNVIIKNDIFEMEKVVSIIENCNRDVATFEVKRREITKTSSMSEIVNSLHDTELEDNVRKIKMLLEAIVVQKNSNELLIKQGLAYTNKLLSILNPDRSAKTYNSYGRVSK